MGFSVGSGAGKVGTSVGGFTVTVGFGATVMPGAGGVRGRVGVGLHVTDVHGVGVLFTGVGGVGDEKGQVPVRANAPPTTISTTMAITAATPSLLSSRVDFGSFVAIALPSYSVVITLGTISCHSLGELPQGQLALSASTLAHIRFQSHPLGSCLSVRPTAAVTLAWLDTLWSGIIKRAQLYAIVSATASYWAGV